MPQRLGHSPIYGDKMTKITLHLEGEAYSDLISIADKFSLIISDRLSHIEKLIDQNASAIASLREELEGIGDILGDLEKFREDVDDTEK